MHIEKLYLSNFKNYEELSLPISNSINCFVGENGGGKTNILDAIYFLLLTKSSLNADNQLIKKDCNQFIVTTNLTINSEKHLISSSLEKGSKKQFLVDKEPYKKLSDHIGRFPVVMISPYDTSLIHEGSEVRRRFFDGIIAQIDPAYLGKLMSYNKILKQRNSLLKKYHETKYIDKDLLWSLDKQLIPLANDILAKRTETIKYFTPVFHKFYNYLSDDKEEVTVEYRSKLLERDFKELLTDYFEKDLITGRTNSGVHKDDFIFEIEGSPINKFGSQGQQKTFIMALKFANYKLIENSKEVKPILLLDDIFDRIDHKRIGKFVEMVKNQDFGQLFISDTHQDRIETLFSDLSDNLSIFKVENGTIV